MLLVKPALQQLLGAIRWLCDYQPVWGANPAAEKRGINTHFQRATQRNAEGAGLFFAPTDPAEKLVG